MIGTACGGCHGGVSGKGLGLLIIDFGIGLKQAI